MLEEPTFLETVLHTCSVTCLYCRTFSTLQFALVISPDVTLLLMGDLLHELLHAIALLHSTCSSTQPDTGLQLVLLYRATVLFLGILVSSLILLLIFGITLLSV